MMPLQQHVKVKKISACLLASEMYLRKKNIVAHLERVLNAYTLAVIKKHHVQEIIVNWIVTEADVTDLLSMLTVAKLQIYHFVLT